MFGSFFRYLRIVPGFNSINELPYLFTLIMFILILVKVIQGRTIKRNMAYLVLAISGIVIIGIFYSLLYGLMSQLSHFSNLVSPLVIIYFIGVYDNTKIIHYKSSLKVFLVISFILTFLEFYFYNILNIPLFDFSSYWNGVGVSDFHASSGNYLFLGSLTRPWGVLAMPQASGAIFAVFFIYFTLIVNENRWNVFYVLISALGVYISASRSAMLALLVGLILLALYVPYLLQNQKNKYLKKAVSRWLIISMLPLVSLFVIFGNWSFTVQTFEASFYKSVLGFYFNPQNLMRAICGTANSGFNNSEYGLINNVISIGLINLGFLSFFVLKLIFAYSASIDSKKLKSENLKYLLPALTFLFGGMHYNLFRYPANIIFAIFVGLMVRNLFRAKEYKQL